MPASCEPAEDDLAEERLRIAVLHEAALDQEHHRVDVARGAGRIDERDRLAAQVLQRLDARALAHVDARGERALAVPEVPDDDHRPGFAAGQDVAARVHEREVRRPVPERLDHRGVVGGDRHPHRHADESRQHLAELLAGRQQVGRLLRGRENQVQSVGGGARARGSQDERKRPQREECAGDHRR